MRDRFREVNIAIMQLSKQVRDGFDMIRKDLADIELDEYMASLQAMNVAYENMQHVTLQPGVTAEVKKLYTDKYRVACNRPHYTAEDIFRNLYGYACGDNQRQCGTNEGTGSCKFGVRKRHFIFDIIIQTANKLPSSVRGIGEWLMQAMILAQFHSDVCLPADATTCNDPFTDPIRNQTAVEQMLAFQEVASNIEREVHCLQNVTFQSYLSGNEFYTDAVPNGSCNPASVDHGNGCMAEKTKKVLDFEYPDKEWTYCLQQ
jgi:hypothetical protein